MKYIEFNDGTQAHTNNNIINIRLVSMWWK